MHNNRGTGNIGQTTQSDDEQNVSCFRSVIQQLNVSNYE